MSLLDMDERLLELAGKIDVVFSPLVDQKEFPENVDVALVEGAVSSDEDLEKILKVRARSRLLVSLGDCAVTANIPSMRNPFKVQDVLDRAYVENATLKPGAPREAFPPCFPRPGRSTNLSTWTCTCRVALPPPTPSTWCWRKSWRGDVPT